MPTRTNTHLSRTEIPTPARIATRPGAVHSPAIPLPVWSLSYISWPSKDGSWSAFVLPGCRSLPRKLAVSIQRVQQETFGLSILILSICPSLIAGVSSRRSRPRKHMKQKNGERLSLEVSDTRCTGEMLSPQSIVKGKK